MQPDGKILVGGEFATLAGAACARIGRLTADGARDPAFLQTEGADDMVRIVAVQPDGKILVGGHFRTLGGQARDRIGRLEADGTLDAGFNPGADCHVKDIVVQPDGNILVGGFFTNVAGVASRFLTRLHGDGRPDALFRTGGVDGPVRTMALQPDGKIVIGGDFTQIGGRVRNHLARLNPDGSLDASFDPPGGANGIVYALALQPDGKIVVGGDFTTLGEPRKRIARLNPDGTLDAAFDSTGGANDNVVALAVQPDGNLLVGGAFTTLRGLIRNRVGRLLAGTGGVDATFYPAGGADHSVFGLAVQPDGRILAGGLFGLIGGLARDHLARLDPGSGAVEAGFNPDAASYLECVTVQSDGRIVAGLAPGVQRFRTNGTRDLPALPAVPSEVYCTAQQADGKILLAGYFLQVGGQPRHYLARLNLDGTLDAGFVPAEIDGPVYSLALQPDGRIILGGWFQTVGGAALNGIARLTASGSLDPAFDPGGGTDFLQVYAVALLRDGRILAGGKFTRMAGQLRRRLACLNPDGSLDPSFNLNFNDLIYSISLQEDGRVVVGGEFTVVFPFERRCLALLTAAGTLDTGATLPGGANARVFGVAHQPDGKVLVGGDFTMLGGQPRVRIARLSNPVAALQSLEVNGPDGVVTWRRGGSAPRVGQVVFHYSTNGTDWTSLGVGAAVSDGWQAAGATLPVNRSVTVRARGFARGGYHNGSGSLIESVRLTFLTAGVHAASADYDGDRLADPAVYDEADGTWRVLPSGSGYARIESRGLLGGYGWRPAPADFDGDGLADPAVCQVKTGTWRVLLSGSGYALTEAAGLPGGPGWQPAAGDYDGDRLADPAACANATGSWKAALSGSGYAVQTAESLTGAGFAPAAGDYDGDGLADPGAFRAADGTWQALPSSQAYARIESAGLLGHTAEIAAPADYDGDRLADPAVFRAESGDWSVLASGSGYALIEAPGLLK